MTVILTDIEGTTSSISFVKDVLFPYATKELPAFIHQHALAADVAALVDQIKVSESLQTNDDVIAQCLQWISEDKKQTQLKALQGLIWKHGYENGDYQAHVYDDANLCMRTWHQAGIPLYIYSSGSIFAQKLFFGYSCFGDLQYLFRGYFDTTSGPKQECNSYQRIATAIGAPPADICFLSDVVAELDAAKAAGMQTIHVQREPGMSSSVDHQVVHSFSDIHVN